jgi:glycosyltransferase involved in cell wall biosynthesis
MLKNKMENQPLVSIILPAYNSEKHIQRAVESALKQSYKNIEVIIIDDSQNDNTMNIVSVFRRKDDRIIYIKHIKRLGFVKSLNQGIKIAKGEYIARLDSDDFWCDQRKLEKQVGFFEDNPDYVLCGGGCIVIDDAGRELYRWSYPEKDIRNTIFPDNQFVHSTVVFRKSAYELTGGYDEQLNYCEDWDLWLRMGKIGKLYNFQDYFACYLQGSQNRSNRTKECKLAIQLIKKYRNDYPGYRWAILTGWLYYIYSLLPTSFRKLLLPISSKLREMILNYTTPR